MGVYERVEGKVVKRRGVWQVLGGIDRFLCYCSSQERWVLSNRENMEAGNGKDEVNVKSSATTPDQITEQWRVHDGTTCFIAPKVRVQV
jgi:hypothetical protein